MRRCVLKSLSVLVGVGLLTVGGCSRQDTGTADTSRVETAFQDAPVEPKSEVQKAVTAVRARDYAGALAALKKAAANVQLTPEQKKAVEDLVQQLEAKVTEVGNKAMGAAGDTVKQIGDSANKAAENVKESLKK